MRWTVMLLALAAGCVPGQETFDPEPLGSIRGYESWQPGPIFTDAVAGHGDTVRVMFLNDVAASYSHGGRYPVGSILVKEIRQKTVMDGVPFPGDIDYVSVMRKVGRGADAPVPVEGGWVFSYLSAGDDPGGEETYWDLCWATCHRQAPWDGAFYAYGP